MNRFYNIVQAVCLVAIAVMAYVLLAVPCQGKPLFPLPPELDKVSTYGCNATQVQIPASKEFRWFVKVMAMYPAGDKWTQLYAVREGTDRRNAMKDCSEWMANVEKALKKVKKTGYQEVKPPPEPEEEDLTPDRNNVRKV